MGLWNPSPAPPGFAQGAVSPERNAGPLSRLLFGWLSPLLAVGFSRPLEKDDLWTLPPDMLTQNVTDALEANFYARVPEDKRPAVFRHAAHEKEADGKDDATAAGSTHDDPDLEKALPEDTKDTLPTTPSAPVTRKRRAHWFTRPGTGETPLDRRGAPKHDSSLLFALNTTFFVTWWTAGFLRLVGDVLTMTSPLVSKRILEYLGESYAWHHLSPDQQAAAVQRGLLSAPRGIGYGIGLGFGLFAMQTVSSLMTNHFQVKAMRIGLCARMGLIGSIFRKSLRLSGKARAQHSAGQITTMISTDATRMDMAALIAHDVWLTPIQVILGIALLINNLGYSALVGLGVLVFSFPVQIVIVRFMFRARKRGVKITDMRVRLTGEVLQGIRLIKLYAWEAFYAHQLGELRAQEVRMIRRIALGRALMISFFTFVPVAAAVLSFITYALTGHDLNVAVIFSSLMFFNLIRMPLVMLPFAISMCADSAVALGRIGAFLQAEEAAEAYAVEEGGKEAVRIEGEFQWETVGKAGDAKFGLAGKGKGKKEKKERKDKEKKEKKAKKAEGKGEGLPTTAQEGEVTEKEEEKEEPFALRDLQLRIPKGAFVAIVGRVGSGKSSLLQAMIGEMRRLRGEVVFGGSVAYVPQTAWIMNATLRENVLFGREDDEAKFRAIVHACSLDRDLAMLPHGEATAIGEKGINLSGGQKARVSLARAAYSGSDIVLLDDSLSAVDAYVGKAIVDNCLLSGPMADKTRVLVTHSLHVLDKTDYIYVMDNGVIAEQGTYQELLADSTIFARLIEEYGTNEETELEKEVAGGAEKEKFGSGQDTVGALDSEKTAQAALMQEEERNLGAVSWETYGKYIKFAGTRTWALLILTALTLVQGASVANNLFLGFWTAESIDGFSQGQYMAVYAGLGVAQAMFTWVLSFSFSLMTLSAGLRMFKAALNGVLRSPVSFFDTTPMGRIVSRMTKDQDTLDTLLVQTLFQLMITFASVMGTIALIFWAFPYLGIILAPLSVMYYLAAAYYRRTSVETKRLDSLMRSALYASYTETLTGLSTVRAYREQDRFVRNAERGLDGENRAYYLTVTLQRWLGIRMDFFGNLLILGISLFAAGFRTTVNPSKTGVVLSYTLSIVQFFSMSVSQFAQNEQNMNAVERILVYTELPAEGATTTPNDPPPSWPEKGEIKFTNVKLAYREGLPLVLKDVSFDVRAGEKVGIVGRTGAGKSSLLHALFRMVELSEGTIEIDGRNTRDMGLDSLRSRLALVPQDTTLFLGTLRENIDPQNTRTDAELISALQRSWLLPRDGTQDAVAEKKFGLDATVGDEGGNYSAGEKQLLALCRALVKNSRIIVLDEATSSVDVETDAKLQKTIQDEFASSTLLCIAHRLNTICYYDRVIVMDAGEVAEYDTPLNLFDKEDSIFRSLCNEARLSREDIVRIRAGMTLGSTVAGL